MRKKEAEVSRVFNVRVFCTYRHDVQVEAENEEQAVERATGLELSSVSYVDGGKEHGEDVWESNDFFGKPHTHEEGWKYIA